MIKLTVEIKDEKFIYSYEVGAHSKSFGEISICPDSLSLFTSLLKGCSQHHHSDHEAFMREVSAKAWIEKNPEEAQKVINEKK